MADIISSAAAAAAARGSGGYSGFGGYGGCYGDGLNNGPALGKSVDEPQPMGQALPRLQVRASGPGVEIRWEDFNYPPCLRLIHFDISELQMKHRKIVRLLNFAFVLTTFICALNLFDTLILWASTTSVPNAWVVQSFLHILLLPAAALCTFYIGYRGLAAPEPLLVHRFQLAQLALFGVSVLFALLPFHCVNGLLTLATSKPYHADGMQVFWIVAILVESMLWMLNACLALLNVARVRRVNILPTNVYNSPPIKARS